MSRDMAKQLKFLFIYFCIGGCCAGVVPRNFREHNNDIMNMALEQSDVKNESFIDAVQTSNTSTDEKASVEVKLFSSLESPSANSSGLLNSNSGKNSSEIDSRSLQIPNSSLGRLNVTANVSKDLEMVMNQLLGTFDPEENAMQLYEDSDSIPIHASNETIPVLIQSELLSNTNTELTSDNNTDFVTTDDDRLFGEISNKTDGLLQTEWPKRNLNETEHLKIHPNEMDSKNSSLSPNETESNILEFLGNITDAIEGKNGSSLHNDSKNISSSILNEIENPVSVNMSEGLFSNFGLEFLKNSEVAKNAAMAMEVFNLTDSSLTDHIIEDHEFHGFLDPVIPTLDDGHLSSTSLPVVELNSSNENLSSPERVTEKNNILFSEDKNTTLNISEQLQTETDTPGLLTSVTQLENVNETLELENFTESIEERNETLILNMSTTVNSTDITESAVIEQDSKNATNVVPKCPPPGICFFWFLSQDTCAVNNHCLGSRICCRIRCSKTCVEIS